MTTSIPSTLVDLVPHREEVQIPKIIHQTYKSIAQLPEVWKDTPLAWKVQHPSWTYLFWSDEDCRTLVKEKFPDFLATYDSYEYNIQRADAIRPMILYEFGGLYADCDIQPIKPFDDLFYKAHDLYFIRSSNGDVVTNCLMASKPKVKFWKFVIEEMKHRAANPGISWIGKHITVMKATGPLLMEEMYEEYKQRFDVKFLPREFISPSACGTCSAKPCSVPMGYTRLLEGASWIGKDTMCYNFIMCRYGELLVCFALSFLFYFVYSAYSGSEQ